MINILLVDNYDSFTFNLQNQLNSIDSVNLIVKRNNQDFLTDLEKGNYDGVIIGPGPGTAEDEKYFGHNKKIILKYGTKGLPIFGVCLGFQGIIHCFGGKLKVSELPMHGKVSKLTISHKSKILEGLNDCDIMRYHSIIADLEQDFPNELIQTAFAQDNTSNKANGKELMAIQHSRYPIYGVQFHPESFATHNGDKLIKNFIELCKK